MFSGTYTLLKAIHRTAFVQPLFAVPFNWICVSLEGNEKNQKQKEVGRMKVYSVKHSCLHVQNALYFRQKVCALYYVNALHVFLVFHSLVFLNWILSNQIHQWCLKTLITAFSLECQYSVHNSLLHLHSNLTAFSLECQYSVHNSLLHLHSNFQDAITSQNIALNW